MSITSHLKNTFIIINNTAVAVLPDTTTPGKARNGIAAVQRSAERIDANREWNLVNSVSCKASSAKRWQSAIWFVKSATEINPGEFYIS